MTAPANPTVGETLIALLEANGVEVVFGIPGVHTVELYRGLASSPIRHVTPRHEQGAGFMADGYARVSGKPGVCLVITGPGLTNTLTAMAQARADSVPMLVISGVNRRATLGHGRGALHELPDQRGTMATVALLSHTLLHGPDLPAVIARAFAIFGSGRPGPVHIEIPVDAMAERIDPGPLRPAQLSPPHAGAADIAAAAAMCGRAERPAMIVGGGARSAAPLLAALAERLDAPVVTTANARGLLAGHPLEVPASPSLPAVRHLLAGCDLVLAMGTEMGPTDFDVFGDGAFPRLAGLVRIDIDAAQIARGPVPALGLVSGAATAAAALLDALPGAAADRQGAARARSTRDAALGALPAQDRRDIAMLATIRAALPGCIVVGDSTQVVYAGNLYGTADRPGGWFNSATGYGTLGYAPAAAIGASLAEPATPVVCLVGDGGLQFTLAELGSAADAGTPVIFVVWNNRGYREIEIFMRNAGIAPVGVTPQPPDFCAVAAAYGLPAERLDGPAELAPALGRARATGGPALIEIRTA